MPVFRVVDQHQAAAGDIETVTPLHFGGNTLINYSDFLEGTSDYREAVAELGVKTFRYPGGSVTEHYFDMTRPEASQASYRGAMADLVPFKAFLRIAADYQASATVVLPTRHGLTKSAEQSLLDGDYGTRDADAAFVRQAANFALYAVRQAENEGVTIDAFEIGNEYWGSGKMTSKEYGRLAAEIAVAVEAKLTQAGMHHAAQPDILVQGIAAAGKYAPTPISSNTLHVFKMSDGSLHSSSSNVNVGETPRGFSNTKVSVDYGPITVPDQGWVKRQNADILDELRAVNGAVNAMDGFVLHYYGDTDLARVDTEDQLLFEIFDILLEIAAERSPGRPELVQYLTEWNMRGGQTHPSDGFGGLIQASYLVEMFYEMVTNGIEAAHTWPMRNEGTQLSSMLDVDGVGLSLAGEALRLMGDLTIGMTPSLDYELDHWSGGGHIDVHGFTSSNREVLIVSERGGVSGIQTLDLSGVLSGQDYFWSVNTLTTNGNPTNPNSEPVIIPNGISNSGSVTKVDLLLPEYALAFVEVTYVTNGADVLIGQAGNDRINGKGGNDRIQGGLGDDSLYGGQGDDELYGQAGDDVLYGELGNDILVGGAGSDGLIGRAGNDLLQADSYDLYANGGEGMDTLSFETATSAVSIWTHMSLAEFDDWVVSYEEIETIEGTKFGDRFSIQTDRLNVDGGLGNDVFEVWSGAGAVLEAGAGDDFVFVYGPSAHTIHGGDGDDVMTVLAGGSVIDGGRGDDVTRSFNANSDRFVFEDGDGRDEIFGFEAGVDILDLTGVSAGDVSTRATSDGTLIDLAGPNSILLHDVFDLEIGVDLLLNA